MMEYKGYLAEVEIDLDAKILHGRVINIRDVVTFQASAVEDLRKEFEASVEDYLEFCVERGEAPEKPYSGRIFVRMDPMLHRDITTCALKESLSVNRWIVTRLREATIPRLTRAVSTPVSPVKHLEEWTFLHGLLETTRETGLLTQHEAALNMYRDFGKSYFG